MLFPLRTLLLILSVLLQVQSTAIPKRDYELKNYYIFEIDTSISQQPLADFTSKYRLHYKFEHQLQGLDNHYVFSINKSHPHNDFLGNHKSNDFNLMKRSPGFEDEYDYLVSNPHLRSIHQLKPRTLSKRMPVLITDDKEYERIIDSKRADAITNFPVVNTVDANTDAAGNTVDASKQLLKDVSDSLSIRDPGFIEQWHLINTAYPGHDVNVTGLWYEGITGTGIVSAIVDDGLDAESEDLRANFNAKGSWDFNDNTNIPLPRLYDDHHGTRCAGEIAAVKNDVCGVGVAYDSTVAGIRILSGPITAAEEAAALIYGLDVNDIYSCSWGPTDDGRTLAEPETVVKKAMIKGVQEGRKDKGSIYVFASGNGGRSYDSCNYDGYTNSIFSITVGAIDYKGIHPDYAEACSAVMVVTYSSGSGEHIHTTDIKKRCTASHGGTSAAAPLAAGIYALVLQANPNLTWRDVQYVSVLSSVPINQQDGNYQTTALNREYSHKYGYGKIDAYQMVHFAKDWKNVKPQAFFYSDIQLVRETLETNAPPPKENNANDGVEKPPADSHKRDGNIIRKKITVTEEDLKIMNVERVEHVTVKLNIMATFRGRVGVRLISPTGVTSDLATFRPRDNSGVGFKDWTFMSVAHWGESGLGDWTIEVFGDENSSKQKNTIVFENWQLRFFGESIDADKAETYELEKDYAAVRRDRLSQNNDKQPETTSETLSSSESVSSSEVGTSTVSTESSTSVTSTSDSTTPVEEDHNAEKVTESVSASSSSTQDAEATESSGAEEDEDGKLKYSADHTGQYFMALAVVGFIVIILFMKFFKTPGSGRRRRREDFEFDIIPGEDYSDSEDDEDSMEFGRRSGRRAPPAPSFIPNEVDDEDDDRARDRVYDEFNSDTLPEYEEEMFRIDDEDEDDDHKKPKKTVRIDTGDSKVKEEEQRLIDDIDDKNPDDAVEDERLINTGSSSS